MPQDAYYYFYAQHPALCYFDHPPGIAWLLRLFTQLFGSHVYVMKMANSVLTVGTAYGIYQLSGRILSAEGRKKTLTLFLSTLMATILSLVSTPDTPLLFFWTWSLVALYDAIFAGRKHSWLIAGVLVGLAFQSKYTGIFLPFGLLIFLLTSERKRHLLLLPWLWLGFLLMLLVISPVIFWNVNNHFASFAFQGTQRMQAASAMEFKPQFVAGLLGHQLALLMPVALACVCLAAGKIMKDNWPNMKKIPMELAFLLCFFLPVFLVFLFLSPIYWIKINWMMPAYVTGLILAGNMIGKKWINLQLVISAVVHLALIAEIVYYPFQIKSDDTWVGWEELSQQVSLTRKKHQADFVFSADSYKTTAELNLYMPDFVYGQNVIGERALQFDYIGTDLSSLNGKSALFIDSDPAFKNNEKQEIKSEALARYFSSVEQLAPIIISFHGRPVRKFYVYICRGYKSGQVKGTTAISKRMVKPTAQDG